MSMAPVKPSPGAVAEFAIGGQTLAVVRVAESAESNANTSFELARFHVDGFVYALVGGSPCPSSRHDPPATQVLTARELQIATLVAQGLLNKEVATRLRISEWTVCTHLRRVFAKLGVSTRAAMVYRCASLLSTSADD
jgi:DNA-binding NarL/FixJ family response regulator